jgi:hypothetical protein
MTREIHVAVATPTLIEQQADMLCELNQVLNRHAVGGAFRLMYSPQDLDLTEGEVLVQVVNAERRVLELHPRRLSELGDGEVLHETQTVDPSDGFLTNYPAQARASDCYATTHPNGTKGHLYVL